MWTWSALRAQRRPGREPRRHRLWTHFSSLSRYAQHSTKAGARTPATPVVRCPRWRRRATLNEGRGANPGDTGSDPNMRACWPTLNEGRGANPSDTTRWPARSRSRKPPLNEGRGANPGDTGASSEPRLTVTRAQRRPGREPRRHPAFSAFAMSCASAQRRPGREPRRHRGTGTARRPSSSLNEGRGANPDDTRCAVASTVGYCHAQRRPGREPRRHSAIRSPPTRQATAQRRPGREPRRHSATKSATARFDFAQRRPGREPRRHLRPPRAPASDTPLNEGRGANPGDTTKPNIDNPCHLRAQRRPGREPRRHVDQPGILVRHVDRSTKAGARTPATRKGVDRRRSQADGNAQRRPGREPRRHSSGSPP